MSGQNFTSAFTVDNSPEEVFEAINNVRSWWSEEVVGETTKLGDKFTFEVPGVHRTTQTLTEVIPGKKIVWQVSDSWIGFVEDKTEWDGTDIVFEISEKGDKTEVRLTHVGLVPSVECYDACTGGWSAYMAGSLRDLIMTGKGDPHRADGDFDSETAKHEAVNKTSVR
jgi:uncharacterized protein YndB with AHSA1/START domain